MEITIPHNQLVKALELVSRISTKHVTLPVLQCVRLEAKEGKVTFPFFTGTLIRYLSTLLSKNVDSALLFCPAIRL